MFNRIGKYKHIVIYRPYGITVVHTTVKPLNLIYKTIKIMDSNRAIYKERRGEEVLNTGCQVIE